jgi:hypothetical protein
MTIGGWEVSMASPVCSLPTTFSWMSRLRISRGSRYSTESIVYMILSGWLSSLIASSAPGVASFY